MPVSAGIGGFVGKDPVLLSHGERCGVGDEPYESSWAEQRSGKGWVSDVAQGVRATDGVFCDEARVGGGRTSLAFERRVPGDRIQEGTDLDVFAGAFYGESSFVRRKSGFRSDSGHRILQAYQARLRIDYVLNVHPNRSYAGVVNPRMTKMLQICEIAFEAFFEDTKQVVAVGVRADIARRKAKASSREELNGLCSRGEWRETCLRSWLKERFPLGYGDQDKESTYQLLLKAVSPDEDAIAHGLPNWNEFGTNHEEFAKRLFDMSRPGRPTAPKAPIVRKGSFLPVLKVAHQALLELSDMKVNVEEQERLMTGLLKKSLKVFKVRYFPAAKPKSGRVGAPNSRPVFDSWGHLGLKDKGGVRSRKDKRSQGGGTVTVAAATVALEEAMAKDCNAEWWVKEVNLGTLRKVICKTSLPMDFTLASPSEGEYVNETYLWVKENYDGAKAVHHLALLVGIIVASTLLPNLFMPTGMKKKFVEARTEEKVREVFEDMEWEGKGRKGMSERGIFIGMFTTFIIAIYEEESPLRKHMKTAQRGGLGDHWTAKHCEQI
jgi:hypothetical protein